MSKRKMNGDQSAMEDENVELKNKIMKLQDEKAEMATKLLDKTEEICDLKLKMKEMEAKIEKLEEPKEKKPLTNLRVRQNLDKIYQITANGFEELIEKLDITATVEGRPFFIYFTGTKLAETGKSWCLDCVRAEPIIEEALEKVYEVDGLFITCNVGFRDEWKSPTNPIKMDAKLGVKCIPTLIQYSMEKGETIEGRKLEKDEDFVDSSKIMAFLKND